MAKDGEPFFLCPPDGQVPCADGHGYGLYHHDCRFLDGYELRIAGSQPNPLAATEAEGTRIVIELTNPSLRTDRDEVIPKEQLGLTWTRSVEGRAPALDRGAVRCRRRTARCGQHRPRHPPAGPLRRVLHAVPGLGGDLGAHDRAGARRGARVAPVPASRGTRGSIVVGAPLFLDHGPWWFESVLAGLALAALALVPTGEGKRFGGGWRALVPDRAERSPYQR